MVFVGAVVESFADDECAGGGGPDRRQATLPVGSATRMGLLLSIALDDLARLGMFDVAPEGLAGLSAVSVSYFEVSVDVVKVEVSDRYRVGR